ncbi:RHS repeat protein [Shewanella sp. VB17]|uniref:RHS repeat-associated core domain-containing protein n=1 Tax=Shewanella sp. VB17 TaxID=2739432 RepID=UPI0015649D5D|nr:RHS repeat-associated core domain-containing protein [Shewanella sp. VB17]NRD72171.1 RHS repeat protein [Shewanella sp. VB17]
MGTDNQNRKAELISSSEAAKQNFTTDNILSGGCVECGCTALIHYHYDDGKPVPNASFVLTDSNSAKIEGKTDDKGLCLIQDMGCGSFELLLEEGSDEFSAPETKINNPVLQANPEYAAIAGEYFSLFVILRDKGYLVYDADDSSDSKVDVDDSSILLNIPDDYEPAYERFWELNEQINDGSVALRKAVNKIHTSLPAEVSSDANDNASILLFCEIALGFVPVVGQAIDLYDVGKWGWTTYSEEGSRSDPWHWALGSLAIVGFVPGLGDALKKTGNVVIDALKKSDSKSIQAGIKMLRSLSNGNLVKYLTGFASSIKEYGNKALDLLKQIIAGLKQALANAAKSNWIVRLLKDGFDGMIKSMQMLADKIDEMIAWISDKVAEFIDKVFTKLTGSPRPKGTNNPIEPVNAGKDDIANNNGQVLINGEKSKNLNNGQPAEKAKKCEGEPIDMATGNVVEWRTDFSLQGLIALSHTRFYHSGSDKISGLLGRTWRSSWDVSLTLEDGIAIFTNDKGAKAHYALPQEGESQRAAHMPSWRLERHDGALYMRHLDGTYLGFNHSGFTQSSHVSDKAQDTHQESSGQSQLLLTDMIDNQGNRLHFLYERTKLKWILLSDDKQRIRVDLQRGRMMALTLCDAQRRPLKTLTTFNYNRHGQLTQVRGDAGHNFDYQYDVNDNLLRWSDLSETWVEHTYDEQGRALSTRASNGSWQDQTRYDDDENIIFYKSPHQGVQCFYRDERNNIIKHIDANGNVTLSTWQDNQLIAEVNALGERTQYSYDDWGQVSSITSPDGSVQAYDYDDDGLLLSVTNPLGAQWQYEYDSNQNLIKAQDPLARAWHYEYNERGQLTIRMSPDGLQTGFTYTEQGHIGQITPPLGDKISFKYDPLGRLAERITHVSNGDAEQDSVAGAISASRPKPLVRRWHYADTALHPSYVVFEDGSQQHFDYDIEGNLTKVVDPLGQVYGYRYGAFDSLIESTDPLGHTTEYKYNKEGQFEGVVNSQRHQWRYHYNSAGQIIKETHYDGRVTLFDYDALGRVSARTTPDGAQLCFYYDDLGRLIQKQAFKPVEHVSASDPIAASLAKQKGSKPRYIVASNTFFEYDMASQLIKATSDDCRSEPVVVEYEYDLSGRRISECINGQVILSEYHGSGQRSHVLTSDADKTAFEPYQVQLDYQQGQLRALQIAEHSALQFQHNTDGFETLRSNGQGFELAQEWSLGGDLLSQQLTEVNGQHAGLGGATQFESHQRGPSKPQGYHTLQRRYQYDALARISEIDESHWGKSQFKHNANGQITHHKQQQAWSHVPAQIKQFDYDSEQNLTEVSQLTFDGGLQGKAGQSTNRHSTNNVLDFSAKRLEKQLKYQKGGRVETLGNHTYRYDVCGRVCEKITQKKGFRPQISQYLWDEEDRLIKAILPNGDTWAYQYDAFGRRVAKIKQPRNEAQAVREAQATNIHYLWDGDNLIEQQKRYADGTLYDTTQWIYEPDSFRPLAQRVVKQTNETQADLEPQLHYIINDHAGTARELCTEDGHIEWRGQQTLWGEHKSHCNSESLSSQLSNRAIRLSMEQAANDPVNCDLRYQGQVYDQETGLYYNRHRYYDPDSCQYLTPDPIGMAGGIRPQAYVHNPMEWVDPLGLAGHPKNSKGNEDPLLQSFPEGINYDASNGTVKVNRKMSVIEAEKSLNTGKPKLLAPDKRYSKQNRTYLSEDYEKTNVFVNKASSGDQVIVEYSLDAKKYSEFRGQVIKQHGASSNQSASTLTGQVGSQRTVYNTEGLGAKNGKFKTDESGNKIEQRGEGDDAGLWNLGVSKSELNYFNDMIIDGKVKG